MVAGFYSSEQLVKMAKGYLDEARKLENENHALWCKVGAHSFDPQTRGYERWTKEVNNPDTGLMEKVSFLVCPDHLGKSGNPSTIPAVAIQER